MHLKQPPRNPADCVRGADRLANRIAAPHALQFGVQPAGRVTSRRSHTLHLLMAGLLALILSGCGERGTDPFDRIQVDTLPGGMVVTSNPSSGAWQAGEEWTVDELFRIGELEGTGPTVLGEIRAIGVASDGTIHLFDHLAHELRVFAADGTPLRVTGRAGAGPGEFRNVVGLGVSPEREVWIADGGNQRYTVVDEAGGHRSFPRTSRLTLLPVLGGWGGGFDLEGRFHERASDLEDGEQVHRMLEVAPDGEVANARSIPRVPVALPSVGGGSINILLPYGPRGLTAWDPRGALWLAHSSHYELVRVGFGGDTLQVIRRELEPVPLSPVQRDSIDAVLTAARAMNPVIPEGAVPDQVSPLRWMAQDDENHMWVCAGGTDPCSQVDLFDRAGRYLGVVSLPAPVLDQPAPIIRNGRFHAAIEGPMGEPQLLVGQVRVR